ncbi:MAG: hypothetical protein M1827_001744 [Pycnora praestabilis]|nr:MAG: hypothetical protein M1827_001744 [Pycnora praestabilis]
MFSFTPLLGAQSISPASQSLLELDGGVKILVDVGWDESFNIEKLKDLERQIPTLSIVLLTHATPAHISAFAHCCKHLPLFLRIPVYATAPVISLGRTLLQDIYASTPLASTIIPTSSLSENSYSYSSSISTGEKPNILLQPPTPEEIATYFSLVHPLKYSQPHQPLPSPFSPPLNGLTITAYNAGHTLGGTIWHIQHGLESIVYAVDWNQARENVLAGAAWLGGAGAGGAEVIEQLRKPTALICSSRGAERLALPGGRKKRDEQLLDLIEDTVAGGGTVLIPTDSSARVLELAYLLEHAWRKECSDSASQSALKNAKLYLASKTVDSTMRYARSMVEWMDDSIIREIEGDDAGAAPQGHTRTNSKQDAGRGGRDNDQRNRPAAGKSVGPFDFKHLKLLERKTQVDRILSHKIGQVVLASDSSLEWGFSKEVLRGIASESKNLIILTERLTSEVDEKAKRQSGLGGMLWDWWQEMKNAQAAHMEEKAQFQGSPREMLLSTVQRIALEGNELQIYQQYLATQRQLQNTLQSSDQATLEASADVVDGNSSSSSSSTYESDPERQGRALNISTTMAHANRNKIGLTNEELGVNILLRKTGVFDYDVRGKKGREKMFPFVAKRRRGDDFGDLIRPEDYLRAEERDDVEGQDMRDAAAGKENKLGQKRKWDDIGMDTGRRISNGNLKRRQSGKGMPRDDRGERVNGEFSVNGNGAVDEAEDTDTSDYEPEEPSMTGPSKVIITTEAVQMSLKIAFVDFAGLHDKRSLQMLIPLIQPRKLILVGGTRDETTSLAEACRTLLGAKVGGSADGIAIDVFTPVIGRMVDASVDTNAWLVKLSESLVKKLQWQNVRGLGVVTITGRLAATPDTEKSAEAREISKKKQKMIKVDSEVADQTEPSKSSSQATNTAPTLDVIPASMAAATRSVAQPLHVGDLRLADLRKILQSAGHIAEFRGEGILLIDGLVAIRKTGTGRIEVEGGGLTAPGPRSSRFESTFYAVKRKIYEGLAVVAGG